MLEGPLPAIEPSPDGLPAQFGRERLESLVQCLLPIGRQVDLDPDPGARPVFLRRLEREDGRRPDFRSFVIERILPLDYFAAQPAASFWILEVTPVTPADGTLAPDDLAGCARSHRRAVVRLSGQLVAPRPEEAWSPQVADAELQHLLRTTPPSSPPG